MCFEIFINKNYEKILECLFIFGIRHSLNNNKFDILNKFMLQLLQVIGDEQEFLCLDVFNKTLFLTSN